MQVINDRAQEKYDVIVMSLKTFKENIEKNNSITVEKLVAELTDIKADL